MTASRPADRVETAAFLRDLRAAVPPEALATEPAAIQKFVHDNSWLSPILADYFARQQAGDADLPSVDVVASPGSVDELRAILALAVRHNVPITPRGRGTSNFGQSIPMSGGLLLDLTRLDRVLDVTDDRVTAEAGTLHADVERAAKARGRDLTVLTTTHTTATVGGWVAGGHVGVGTSAYGSIWDGNVLAVKLLTAEDPPRELYLAGDALFPVLHTYGTVGIISEVTFPLVPAREWVEAVAVFDQFDDAARCMIAMSQEPPESQRATLAQQAPIPQSFTPLRRLFPEGSAGVLMIVDQTALPRFEALVREHRGRWHLWKTPRDAQRLSLNYMVYGHRMLWNKKTAPDAAFLHAYFTPGEELAQLQALSRQFGERVWLELKYMRSAYLRSLHGLVGDGLLPAGVLALTPGTRELIDAVMAYCDDIGVSYLNPHTFMLEESGLFADFGPVLAFKRQTDPKWLLNPDKIGRRFFRETE